MRTTRLLKPWWAVYQKAIRQIHVVYEESIDHPSWSTNSGIKARGLDFYGSPDTY